MKKTLIALSVLCAAIAAQSAHAQNNPEAPRFVPVLPDGVAAPDFELDALKEEAEALRSAAKAEREAVLDALADDATLDEKKAALKDWRETSETVAALAEIRATLGDAIGERPRARLDDRSERFRDRLKNRRDLRRELRSRLEGVEGQAEREQIIADFREEVKALMEQRREERRAEIEAENNGGVSRNNS